MSDFTTFQARADEVRAFEAAWHKKLRRERAEQEAAFAARSIAARVSAQRQGRLVTRPAVAPWREAQAFPTVLPCPECGRHVGVRPGPRRVLAHHAPREGALGVARCPGSLRPTRRIS